MSPPIEITCPSFYKIFAMYPSSWLSYPIVALSVYISQITSPTSTLSPSFLSHLAIVPSDIVGLKAGISNFLKDTEKLYLSYVPIYPYKARVFR
jgi:hypothetical protein